MYEEEEAVEEVEVEDEDGKGVQKVCVLCLEAVGLDCSSAGEDGAPAQASVRMYGVMQTNSTPLIGPGTTAVG